MSTIEVTSLSTDRRTLTIAGASAEAEVTIRFRGQALPFSRQNVDGKETVTLEEPLGSWEALGGFTTIRVDGARIGAGDALIHAERRRLRELIGRQATTERSVADNVATTHGVVPPDTQTAVTSSPVPLPVGAVSPDNSAVVGTNGHLFILGGSNSLITRYATPTAHEDKADLARQVQRWSSLVQRRAETATELGAQFVQMFVPDKSSVLESGVAGLGPITPLLERVERSLASWPPYVSGRDALISGADSEANLSEFWLRLDSHTSARGARLLSRALVGASDDPSFMDDIDFSNTSSYMGDLSARFFGNQIPEKIASPSSEWLESAEYSRTLIAHHNPDRGHNGRMMHWRTPNAPIDAKVLVFGNSFFGARDVPISCNYWVSRAFREHRFVWSAEMIEATIRDERPDLVICQTVERFMPKTPAT